MEKPTLVGTHLDCPELRVDFFSPHKVSRRFLLGLRVLGLVSSTYFVFMRLWIPMAGSFPMYCYMTVWGNFAAVAYFWVIVALSFLPQQKGHTLSTITPFFRFLHILFQLCVGSLFVICLMFWGFLLPQMNKMLAQHPEFAQEILVYCVGTHLIVPFQIWLESYLNHVGFRARDGVVWLPIVAVIYSGLNYYWTVSYGKPVYLPMDWTSISTPIFLGAAFGLAGLGFYFAKALWLWKHGEPTESKKKTT